MNLKLPMVCQPTSCTLYLKSDHFAVQVTASVEEFITMIAGGLAGASPHMISATVTAVSRLVFEFKGGV